MTSIAIRARNAGLAAAIDSCAILDFGGAGGATRVLEVEFDSDPLLPRTSAVASVEGELASATGKSASIHFAITIAFRNLLSVRFECTQVCSVTPGKPSPDVIGRVVFGEANSGTDQQV